VRLAGAELKEVPAVPYKDPNNYVKVSGRLAEELKPGNPNGVIWANQFDNVANRQGHYRTTGPEIWDQTSGKVDGFVSANRHRRHAVRRRDGAEGAQQEREDRPSPIPKARRCTQYFTSGELKSEGSSITEGIGQGRVTKNVDGTPVDFRLSDSRQRSPADRVRPPEGGRPVLGGFHRHQRRRRHPPGEKISAPATPSSPSSPTSARAIRASCSTRSSCAPRGCRHRIGCSWALAHRPQQFQPFRCVRQLGQKVGH